MLVFAADFSCCRCGSGASVAIGPCGILPKLGHENPEKRPPSQVPTQAWPFSRCFQCDQLAPLAGHSHFQWCPCTSSLHAALGDLALPFLLTILETWCFFFRRFLCGQSSHRCMQPKEPLAHVRDFAHGNAWRVFIFCVNLTRM